MLAEVRNVLASAYVAGLVCTRVGFQKLHLPPIPAPRQRCLMVAMDFSPWERISKTVRVASATPERSQSQKYRPRALHGGEWDRQASLRDLPWCLIALCPWTEVHGYLHSSLTRRNGTCKISIASRVATVGFKASSLSDIV